MKFINNILNAIIRAAQNKWVWLRVLILVVVGFAGAILFSKTKKEDCTDCNNERKELLNVLLDIRKDLSEPTSGVSTSLLSFAAFVSDTLPKNQQQSPLNKMIISKIDSILIKIKLDSLKKQKL